MNYYYKYLHFYKNKIIIYLILNLKLIKLVFAPFQKNIFILLLFGNLLIFIKILFPLFFLIILDIFFYNYDLKHFYYI